MGQGPRHGDLVHPARQAEPERLHRALHRTYREAVLDQFLFTRLEDMHEATRQFLIDYNEHCPTTPRGHDAGRVSQRQNLNFRSVCLTGGSLRLLASG